MKLGYAPFGTWNMHSPIAPFEYLFDEGVDLCYEKDLSRVDAVILYGGSDISPSLYNEDRIRASGPLQPSERDLFEWEVCRQAVEAKKPIIGICRGAQLACAFAGGSLIQDVNRHTGDHKVTTFDGHEFSVTSAHHQMMYPYDIEHELLAWSSVNLATQYLPNTHKAKNLLSKRTKEPEVVYFPTINCLAVQCHPEWHTQYEHMLFNEWMFKIYQEKCCGNVLIEV
jgi:putative glutamine amidotransferase